MRTIWRPTSASLTPGLRAATTRSLTYADVGATADPQPPGGYRPLRQAAVVGAGKAAWERLAAALRCWGLHRAAGMLVAADSEDVRLGTTVVNAAPLGPLALLAPCRVVRVIDEPHRAGFAYGTLPGHPLTGEEEFVTTLDDAGRVRPPDPVVQPSRRPRPHRSGTRPQRTAMVNRRYLAAAARLAT